jgi:membrane-bound lytic murein transglycosylase D
MTAKILFAIPALFVNSVFVFLTGLASFSPVIAHADTNAQGDEITVVNDTDADLSPNLTLSPNLSVNPALNYLPDQSTPEKEASNNDLRQRIIDGYGMPNLDSGYTSTHESFYANRPDYVKRMMERSQKYLYHIVVEVEKRGMPSEIALLPMIESGYNPQAYSRSKASGIWQFIPSTGKNFGLKQNWWVDNRRDVTGATKAALDYLQKLHVMFGTWDLALAAYNAGEGTVQRAIDRNRRSGLPTDYASLALPPETRNYVPKLQAMKNIMTNPEHYGLYIQPIANKPYFTKVRAPEQIDSALAAKLAEISFEEFTSLNPEYNRPVITATGTVHEILLPVSAAEVFKDNLANYDKPLVSWQTYHAKRGERAESIARKFGINLAQLKDINDLPNRDKIAGARPLLVPSNGSTAVDAPINTVEPINTQPELNNSDSSSKSTTKVHIVKNKESIAAIAKHYGISAKSLVAVNHLKNGRVKAGQKLVIEIQTQDHNLKANLTKNEQLKIAKNEAKPNKTASNAKSGKNNKIATKDAFQNKYYVVKRGDTLESISRKFDVGRNSLQRWNKISGSHIAPGLTLTVRKADDA